MQIEKLRMQKEMISQKKERLEKKKLLLEMKERKIRTKGLIEVGELVAKAKIAHLSHSALLGAFLEIKERSNDDSEVKLWEARANEFPLHHQHEHVQPLILTFEAVLDESVKTSLKALKFRWNAFRKEWYGFGKKIELEAAFERFGMKIEIVSIVRK